MLDFSALPPEINSARMYSGPGSTSMMAAATAWNTMAADMRSTTAKYGAVVNELSGESWLGPSSAMMVAAITPYLAWLTATATQAEEAGAQANAAAAAFDSAFAATVPPALVTANRDQLSNLLATNIFGQNTAAIAATELEYAEMWAQDSAAMNGYSAASRAATQLTPFGPPQSTTTADAPARQAVAVGQAASAATGTGNVAAAASPAAGAGDLLEWLGLAPGSNTSTTGLAGVLNFLSGSNPTLIGAFLNNATISNLSNGFTTNGILNPTAFIDSVTGYNFLYAADPAAGAAAAAGAGANLSRAALPAMGASSAMGQANLVGSLSVPGAWGDTGAAINPVVSTTRLGAGAYHGLNGATPMVMEEAGSTVGMPGMPMGGIAGAQEDEFSAPIYGVRPRIIGRPPAAG
jgi:PPE-repeat protein